MEDDAWKTRLRAAVKADGRSLGAISLAADQSRNYLGSILRDGSDPTIGKLIAVCKALNVSPVYIIAGIEADQETIDLLALLSRNPRSGAALRDLLGDPKAAE